MILRLILLSTFFIQFAGAAPWSDGCITLFRSVLGKAKQVRRLEDVKEFKVITLNAFFLNAEKTESWRMQALADAISSNQGDIVVLQEVRDADALRRLNQTLRGDYAEFFVAGNEASQSSGFLVKKDLPLDVEFLSHKNLRWASPVDTSKQQGFVRDLPALVLHRAGEKDEAEPLMVILGAHYKSKRTNGKNPADIMLTRQSEAEATASVVSAVKKKYGKDVNIAVAGDFNGDLGKSPELNPLYQKAGLKDAFGDSKERPTTAFYFTRDHQIQFSDTDGFLLSPHLKNSVSEAQVHIYKNPDGSPKLLPQAERDIGKDKLNTPSDHFPVIMTLDFQKLLQGVAP